MDIGGPRAGLVPAADLPLLDEHEILVAAGPEEVWRAAREVVDGAFGGDATARFARLLGCADAGPSGPRPVEVGSTLPGFRVTAAEPGRELVLTGRHRFSAYALTFRTDDAGEGRTRLRAESRATFPGLAGGAYRTLVVRSGGHVVSVRRLLSAIRRRAEGRPADR